MLCPSANSASLGSFSAKKCLFLKWADKNNPGSQAYYLFLKCVFFVFFLSTLLQDCSLCWDCWNGTVAPTLDAALLCSSRAGTDLGQMSDVESDASPG